MHPTCYYVTVTTKQGKKGNSKPNRDQALASKTTPIKLRPRNAWIAAAAARDAHREHQSLTQALLAPGARRDILSYVLGMRTLLTALPGLAQKIAATPYTHQSEVVRQELTNRERTSDILAAKGVPATAWDNLSTPTGVGSAVAFQLGSELDDAKVYALEPAAFHGLLDVVDRLTLTDAAHLDWRGTGTESGFMLFPETLHVADDEGNIGTMVALSWAPGRTHKHPETLRATTWSQSYGDTPDAEWDAVLEAAANQSVALPRLAYGGMAWALPPRAPGTVNLTPQGTPPTDYKDGAITSAADGALPPLLALATINMLHQGTLTTSHTIKTRTGAVHVLALAGGAG